MERGEIQQSLAIATEAHGEVPVVRVAGEIDLATVATLERELTKAISRSWQLVLDLSECTFIDSTGISAIIRADKLLPRRDDSKPLALVVQDPFVTRILERAGIDDITQIHATVADAFADGAAARELGGGSPA